MYTQTMDRRERLRSFRRHRTDMYRRFVTYAAHRGSQSADRYYAHLTRLSNTAGGVAHRKDAGPVGLQQINVAEVLICLHLQNGMQLGLPYKQIYQNCKAAVAPTRRKE